MSLNAPVDLSCSQTSHPEASSVGRGHRAMKTLLVLAEHPDFAEAIRAGVNPEQYRVIARANLDEAEPLLAHGLAEACIVDVELTGVQGIWFLEKLRRKAPRCPVIIYTGAKQSEWEEEAYLQGVQGFWTGVKNIMRSGRMEPDIVRGGHRAAPPGLGLEEIVGFTITQAIPNQHTVTVWPFPPKTPRAAVWDCYSCKNSLPSKLPLRRRRGDLAARPKPCRLHRSS